MDQTGAGRERAARDRQDAALLGTTRLRWDVGEGRWRRGPVFLAPPAALGTAQPPRSQPAPERPTNIQPNIRTHAAGILLALGRRLAPGVRQPRAETAHVASVGEP